MSIFSRIRMWFQLKRLTKKIRVNDLVRSIENQKFLDSHPRLTFSLDDIFND